MSSDPSKGVFRSSALAVFNMFCRLFSAMSYCDHIQALGWFLRREVLDPKEWLNARTDTEGCSQ